MRNGLNFELGNELEKYIFGHVTSVGHRKIYDSLSRNGISDLLALALSH